MAAIFPETANGVLRGALLCGFVVALGVPSFLMVWVRTPQGRGQYEEIEQPVKFDHRHHVNDEGIDCRYCHEAVERSAFAGVPAASVCMGCHGQVWSQSPLLEPVRQAYFRGTPVRWARVHDLPQFVYFNHAIHVKKGVGCVMHYWFPKMFGKAYPERLGLLSAALVFMGFFLTFFPQFLLGNAGSRSPRGRGTRTSWSARSTPSCW